LFYSSDVQQYFFVRHNCGEYIRPFATFQEIAKIANIVKNMAQNLKFDCLLSHHFDASKSEKIDFSWCFPIKHLNFDMFGSKAIRHI